MHRDLAQTHTTKDAGVLPPRPTQMVEDFASPISSTTSTTS
ncbi:hypothetical protein ACIRPX_29365 [Streptomyces sp. NPDC101225]